MEFPNPRYTSQTCHCCLHIGIRSGKSFKCSNQTLWLER
ncbi:MAG UNVERIFIED_CONTAM: transposase [Microcystis novacekii LVE1205-3]